MKLSSEEIEQIRELGREMFPSVLYDHPTIDIRSLPDGRTAVSFRRREARWNEGMKVYSVVEDVVLGEFEITRPMPDWALVLEEV
jgi:hypothetical protein